MSPSLAAECYEYRLRTESFFSPFSTYQDERHDVAIDGECQLRRPVPGGAVDEVALTCVPALAQRVNLRWRLRSSSSWTVALRWLKMLCICASHAHQRIRFKFACGRMATYFSSFMQSSLTNQLFSFYICITIIP